MAILAASPLSSMSFGRLLGRSFWPSSSDPELALVALNMELLLVVYSDESGSLPADRRDRGLFGCRRLGRKAIEGLSWYVGVLVVVWYWSSRAMSKNKRNKPPMNCRTKNERQFDPKERCELKTESKRTKEPPGNSIKPFIALTQTFRQDAEGTKETSKKGIREFAKENIIHRHTNPNTGQGIDAGRDRRG